MNKDLKKEEEEQKNFLKFNKEMMGKRRDQ